MRFAELSPEIPGEHLLIATMVSHIIESDFSANECCDAAQKTILLCKLLHQSRSPPTQLKRLAYVLLTTKLADAIALNRILRR